LSSAWNKVQYQCDPIADNYVNVYLTSVGYSQEEISDEDTDFDHLLARREKANQIYLTDELVGRSPIDYTGRQLGFRGGKVDPLAVIEAGHPLPGTITRRLLNKEVILHSHLLYI
jgi:hypothetical protein